MIVYSAEEYKQMSPEWFDLKKGIPGASTASKILTPTGKPSTSAWGKINELISEITGADDDKMEPTEWMLRGIELEKDARQRFELDMDADIGQVGMITNDKGTAGCSPDGLVGYVPGEEVSLINPGWEVKCPMGKTHCGYLRKAREFHMYGNVYKPEALPTAYKPQVHWSMAVTGIQSWWFVSYHPAFDKQLYTLIKANDYTTKMRAAINKFTAELATEKKAILG